MRPNADLALCPGQDCTRDVPGMEPEACSRRSSCRRYLQAPAGPRQRYVLPDELGEACELFVTNAATDTEEARA